MDWEVLRVVKAGYGSLAEVYEKWSILDLFDVNCTIDAIEFAEAKARAEAEEAARRK